VPEFHAEPYLHLAGLSHKSALITWGAFYFQTRTRDEWKLIDDRDLRHVHPPRARERLRHEGHTGRDELQRNDKLLLGDRARGGYTLPL
jgi:hypothetical protein